MTALARSRVWSAPAMLLLDLRVRPDAAVLWLNLHHRRRAGTHPAMVPTTDDPAALNVLCAAGWAACRPNHDGRLLVSTHLSSTATPPIGPAHWLTGGTTAFPDLYLPMPRALVTDRKVSPAARTLWPLIQRPSHLPGALIGLQAVADLLCQHPRHTTAHATELIDTGWIDAKIVAHHPPTYGLLSYRDHN
ncbi:hypothetical protein D1871_04540 [Nakamurella silvestris]|nr:hypothetical protein D1871_04540 [Nakamurella silvestris]